MACSNEICYSWILQRRFLSVYFNFHFEPFFHGYHVYQHIWTPVVSERYSCIRNTDNAQDKHAIAIVIEERIISHIPVCL